MGNSINKAETGVLEKFFNEGLATVKRWSEGGSGKTSKKQGADAPSLPLPGPLEEAAKDFINSIAEKEVVQTGLWSAKHIVKLIDNTCTDDKCLEGVASIAQSTHRGKIIQYLEEEKEKTSVNVSSFNELFSELAPEDGIFYFKKAESLLRQGKLDKAIAMLNKGIEIDPKVFVLYEYKAEILQAQGRLDEARKVLDIGVERVRYPYRSRFEGMYHNLFEALKEQGKLDEALEALDKWIEINPNIVLPYRYKAAILVKQGKLDEALEVLNKADPKNDLLYFEKAEILVKQGKLGEALGVLDRAIEIDPKNDLLYLLYFEKAEVLVKQGKLDEALSVCNQGLELNPKSSLLIGQKKELEKLKR